MAKQNATKQIRIRPVADKRIIKIINSDDAVNSAADVVDKALDALDNQTKGAK